MKRRTFTALVFMAPMSALAQTHVTSQSIGVGPFEFPIPGAYAYSQSGASTTISVAGSDRRYTVGLLRVPTQGAGAERSAEVVALVKSNWEQFASNERGVVVREFRRVDIAPNLAVLSMATEFGAGSARQYYVQFAATNGVEIAVLAAEGKGSALAVSSELEPLVVQVRRVGQ